jgi:AcrR family transcriptional regulator
MSLGKPSVPSALASAGRAAARPATGLRERKKAQTRLRISDIATEMFLSRGFDAVTVAQVAKAADVSVKTVFNYFGAKEDLLFDREDEWLAAIDELAARRRPAHGLIRVLKDDVAIRWPPLDIGRWDRMTEQSAEGRRRFYGMIAAHPGLRARRLQLGDRQREKFIEVVRRDLGQADAPDATAVAALLSAAYEAVGNELTTRLLAGDPTATCVERAKAVGLEAFSALERAYAGTPLVDGPLT